MASETPKVIGSSRIQNSCHAGGFHMVQGSLPLILTLHGKTLKYLKLLEKRVFFSFSLFFFFFLLFRLLPLPPHMKPSMFRGYQFALNSAQVPKGPIVPKFEVDV